MSGWVHVPTNAELLERDRKYGKAVEAWLRATFPDLCEDGIPHPAAFAAVLRLHKIHGKGCITREHHPLILQAVERFNEEYQQ